MTARLAAPSTAGAMTQIWTTSSFPQAWWFVPSSRMHTHDQARRCGSAPIVTRFVTPPGPRAAGDEGRDRHRPASGTARSDAQSQPRVRSTSGRRAMFACDPRSCAMRCRTGLVDGLSANVRMRSPPVSRPEMLISGPKKLFSITSTSIALPSRRLNSPIARFMVGPIRVPHAIDLWRRSTSLFPSGSGMTRATRGDGG